MVVVPYDPDVEEEMRTLYASLNERDRRRHAAIEAAALGSEGFAVQHHDGRPPVGRVGFRAPQAAEGENDGRVRRS